MTELLPGGVFSGVVALCRELAPLVDLQLRSVQGPECHASVYLGLTSVLDIYERNGLLSLRAHRTHRSAGRFDPRWAAVQLSDWPASAPGVERYLRRILEEGSVDPRWYRREGAVQNAVAALPHEGYGPVQREAVVWSDGGPSVAELVGERSDLLWAAIQLTGRTDPWWPGIRDRGTRPAMGKEVDILAVGGDGRLLCIEVKPAGEIKGITWAPAQAALYVELFARWLADDPAGASQALRGMAAQRAMLGLLPERWESLVEPGARVVPVIAIGAGLRSPDALTRLRDVWRALDGVPCHEFVDPLEVWLLDESGDVIWKWLPGSGEEPPGAEPGGPVPAGEGDDTGDPPGGGEPPVPLGPDWFQQHARMQQARWKQETSLLPLEARVPAPYLGKPPPLPYVLPEAYRSFNLLPEGRSLAVSRFEAAAIHWHGDGEGPNPHLLSSQLQCLNALAPLVDDPESLAAWLGRFLPVAEVLPFGATTSSPYDHDDFVVFEWQGLVDHLGEWHGAEPTRGAMATSVDAAIRYRTPDGSIEMALVEWKYTEAYPQGGRLGGSPLNHSRRLSRYRPLVDDPDAPIALTGGVDYEDLFAEPTYQLLRLQLLAWRIETLHELDVARAVVVYAAPADNEALLQNSLGSHRFARLAVAEGGLVQGWKALLKEDRQGRFMHVDTADLVRLGGLVTEDFRVRYNHLADEPPTDEPPTDEPQIVAPTPDGSVGRRPDTMSGDDLQELWNDADADDVWVGRKGGLRGAEVVRDVASGAWRTHPYLVARGVAAPNAQWFRLADLLNLVDAARRAERARAGWESVGVVVVDSAAIAVATPSAARRLIPSDDLDALDGMAVLVTRVDADFPVEVRRDADEVVEVRVDLVDDLDEIDGAWQHIKTLQVGNGGVVVYDPYRERAGREVVVELHRGRWDVSQFESSDDILGLRLQRP